MTKNEAHFELTIDRREGYLYARVTALAITAEDFADVLSDLADECRRSNCDKLLLYRDVPSMSGVGNTFQIVTNMLKLLPGLTVAIVNPYRSNEEMLRFAADFAHTRGFDLSIFHDEKAALNWLNV